MTLKASQQLKRGDMVLWTDPDNQACSKTIHIKQIEFRGAMLGLTGFDGSYTEVLPSELTLHPTRPTEAEMEVTSKTMAEFDLSSEEWDAIPENVQRRLIAYVGQKG